MNHYSYEGPVMKFDTCLTNHWEAFTYASSENNAKSNLAYQFKKRNNMTPNVKITLPGKLVMVQ